jgi:hypothetical protein
MPIALTWMDWRKTTNFQQGVVVLEISLEGIEVKGWITHLDGGRLPSWRWAVRRALYIGDYLYSISDGLVKVNSLMDLSEVTAVVIS